MSDREDSRPRPTRVGRGPRTLAAVQMNGNAGACREAGHEGCGGRSARLARARRARLVLKKRR